MPVTRLLQRYPVDASVRRRNRIVLVLLLLFIALAFALSFRHVTREMRGAGLDNVGKIRSTYSLSLPGESQS